MTGTARAGGCWDCPVNVVVIQPTPAVTPADPTVLLAVVLLGAALFAVLLGLLVARRLQAGSGGRRQLTPAVVGGATIVVVTVARRRSSSSATVLGTGPEALQDAVATALHDPGTELAFWIPERAGFVDARGETVEPDPPADGRWLAPIERDGARIAVVTHACPDHELVAAVVASVGPAVQNHRRHAAARARLAEVTASRRRIVEAADAERRRIEHTLHDGPQQRLLSVALALRLARGRLARGASTETDELVAEAAAELALGVDELRELARGTYPAALAEAGLAGALGMLADQAPLPVELAADPIGRLPAPVELACWFTAAELLANAAEHAGASRVLVDLRADDHEVVLQVRDDGCGGADAAGSGLRGLADRVASAGGVFAVHSLRGAGTTAVARFPIAIVRPG